MSSFGLNTTSSSDLKTAKSYLNILQRLKSSDKKTAAFLRAELERMPGVRQDVGVAPDERSAVSDAAMEFEDGLWRYFPRRHRAAHSQKIAVLVGYCSGSCGRSVRCRLHAGGNATGGTRGHGGAELRANPRLFQKERGVLRCWHQNMAVCGAEQTKTGIR